MLIGTGCIGRSKIQNGNHHGNTSILLISFAHFFLMTNQVNEQRIPSHANLLYNVDLLLYKVLCRYTKFPTQVNEE